MKKVSRLGLLVCLIMVFALLSSTMALAATETTCPLKNVNNQQVSVDQLLNLVNSNSCSTNTSCTGKSCTDVQSCINKNLCQDPLSCLTQTGATKAAADTSTCPNTTINTGSKNAGSSCPTISEAGTTCPTASKTCGASTISKVLGIN